MSTFDEEAMGRTRREAIPDPRPDSHRKKLMLCIWWDVNGVIYWELLDSKSTLTATVYSQQLDKVAEAVGTKRSEKTKSSSNTTTPDLILQS